MYDGDAPAAGVIAGVGRVSGRECMVVCNDATVKGGTYYAMSVKKSSEKPGNRRTEQAALCLSRRLGGANLPNQDEVFPDRDHFGRIFFNQANMSARGIAQIAVVMGSCTAGGAYVPAMSDVSTDGQGTGDDISSQAPARAFSAATGEVVSAEEFGGADVHTRLRGLLIILRTMTRTPFLARGAK